MPIQDLLADALFVVALSGPAGSRLHGEVVALVRDALARVPALVEHRASLDEWMPLLKVARGDELAGRAAAVLRALLEGCRIRSEVRTNPWMTDGSRYLFVDTESLAAVAQKG